MRYLFLFLLLLSHHLYAVPDSARKARFDMGATFGFPMGKFAYAHHKGSLYTQGRPTWGFTMSKNYMITRRITTGIEFTGAGYANDRDRFREMAFAKHYLGGFQTRVEDYPAVEVLTLSVVTSWLWHTGFAELEPFVQLGTAFSEAAGYNIYRKKTGENYADNIYVHSTSRPYFFPGIGIRANKQIGGRWYATMGIRYNYGEFRCTIHEEKTDFLLNRTSTQFNIMQPVSVILVHAGLQLRSRRVKPFSMQHAGNPPQ